MKRSSKKIHPHILIFSGYGLNTEDETKAVFDRLGATASIVHLNEVIKNPKLLINAEVAVFGGGFAYGDHTGAGRAYANRVRHHLGEALEKFLSRDTLLLGICNGFQILTGIGVLPGALLPNTTPRYQTRWVDLEVSKEGSKSPWLAGITRISVPIAHGEGRYVYDPKVSTTPALSYVRGEICDHFDAPANPNGSEKDTAGVVARDGRILGLMPHPERALRFTELPHWTHVREEYIRNGKPLPVEGPGLALFKNAVQYFV